MMKYIRSLYNWVLHLAEHKHAVRWLAAISFIESSVFPIPPDVLMMPMCLAKREKSFVYGTICAISSVLGGVLGYAIGYFLFDTLGKPVLEFYGLTQSFETFQKHYNEWGLLIVIGAGFVPFPYKIITITSGLTGMNFAAFMFASIIARMVRFNIVAGLLWKFGAPIKAFIEKYLGLLTSGIFLVLLGIVLLLKYKV